MSNFDVTINWTCPKCNLPVHGTALKTFNAAKGPYRYTECQHCHTSVVTYEIEEDSFGFKIYGN